jgi:hypothetical protein
MAVLGVELLVWLRGWEGAGVAVFFRKVPSKGSRSLAIRFSE